MRKVHSFQKSETPLLDDAGQGVEMCRPLHRNDTAGAADMEFRYPDRPVVLVNRFDAGTFRRSPTRKLGGGKWTFALPPVAEREKVARRAG